MSLENLRILNYRVNGAAEQSGPDCQPRLLVPVAEKIYEDDSPDEERRKIERAYRDGILSDDEALSSAETENLVLEFKNLYPDQRRFENKYYEVYASVDGGNFWSKITSGCHCRYDEAAAVFKAEYAKDKNQALKLVEVTENVLASNNL